MVRSISAKVTLDVTELKRRGREGGDEIRRFGRTVKDTSKEASADLAKIDQTAAKLGEQIRATSKAVDDLGKAFAKTGDATLLKQREQQQKMLSELRKAQTIVFDARRGEADGKAYATAVKNAVLGAGDIFASTASGLSKSLPPQVTLALVAGAVAAAPMVSTALVGAVSGGAAGAGIAGGIALALRNPAIKAEAEAVGQDIVGQLTADASKVGPALIKSLGIVRAEFADLGDEFRRIFDNSAEFLPGLAESASTALGSIVEGIDRVIESAGPTMDVLGSGLEMIGGEVENFLNMVADNGDAGASALMDLFTVAQLAIRQVTFLVDLFAKIYNFTEKMGGLGLLGIMSDINQVRTGATGAAGGMEMLTGAVDEATLALQRQQAAAKATSDQIRANADPVFAFVTAQQRLAKAQEDASEATKKHGRNSREAKEALRALAVAGLDVEAAAGQLGETFNGRMTPRLRAAMVAAGLTKEQIAGVARMFRAAKREGEEFRGDYKARVIVEMVAGSMSSVTSAAQRAIEQTRNQIQFQRGRRWGGVDQPVAMAAGGTMAAGIYPASNPPLVRFAEPETGGEAYIPKNGNRARNLAILNEVASWPSVGAQVIPMAAGGVHRTSYVNVAPSTVRTGTRLDSAAAALSARDAVAALNAALRENGRTYSIATSKGRENRTALIAGIRAAQDAARAKYDETGSIKLANAVYDEYLRRLKDVHGQQKTSLVTLQQLAQRPQYDPGGPRSSAGNIGYVQALIGRQQATATARQFFNSGWGKPAFNTGTSFGRDNFAQLFEFLGAAEAAAQARFAQTGNAASATRLYSSSLTSLRSILRQAGMTDKAITALLASYGRITLANRDGGVYEHMASGGLRQAHIAPAGPTRYAYAEPATGGELFAPKQGNLAKTRSEVQWAVTNWWGGGQIPWGNQGGGAMTLRVVVQDGQVAGLVRVEVDEAMGALADATIYQTSA